MSNITFCQYEFGSHLDSESGCIFGHQIRTLNPDQSCLGGGLGSPSVVVFHYQISMMS